jgi:hypothetical protein
MNAFLLVGLCTIVRGDKNNEVLLVSWYWYDSIYIACAGYMESARQLPRKL